MIRSVLRLVGAVTDLVQPPKALLTDPGFRAAQLNETEAEHDGLDPQLFKCYADSCGCQDDDRYAPRECDLCQRLHGEHPTARIACGTTGCPNASDPSAPGLGGLVERTTPEEATPTASSGASTSTASGGGTASVGNHHYRVLLRLPALANHSRKFCCSQRVTHQSVGRRSGSARP